MTKDKGCTDICPSICGIHCSSCGSHDIYIPYSGKVRWGKIWQIDSFRAFGERKFGKLIDQPIDYLL